MVWLLAAVAVVALAIKFRWARLAMLWIAGLAVLAGAILGLVLWEQNRNRVVEAEAAKHRMPIADLQLEDMLLQPTYSSYKLIGRARNNSTRYTTTQAEIQLTLRDCIQENCDVIGQQTETVYLSVPPQQSRGIDQYVLFSSLPTLRGKLAWDYRVTSISASEPRHD
jgi:hypothetical protein